MQAPTEQSIIAAVRAGDREQYRPLVERYHRGLIQHLYNVTHNAQTAEDLAQDAFIRAYEKLAQYNGSYAFSTWLYKIADNLAYRELKQSQAALGIDDAAELIADDKPLPLEVSDRHFTQAAVRAAVQALPPAYAQVVALYYWDECSYEEIAGITDRPIGTVRTWLFRAKAQLRKDLYGEI